MNWATVTEVNTNAKIWINLDHCIVMRNVEPDSDGRITTGIVMTDDIIWALESPEQILRLKFAEV